MVQSVLGKSKVDIDIDMDTHTHIYTLTHRIYSINILLSCQVT